MSLPETELSGGAAIMVLTGVQCPTCEVPSNPTCTSRIEDAAIPDEAATSPISTVALHRIAACNKLKFERHTLGLSFVGASTHELPASGATGSVFSLDGFGEVDTADISNRR